MESPLASGVLTGKYNSGIVSQDNKFALENYKEKFERHCEEQRRPVDKNALFLEAVGGFDKKKRVYGVGSSQDLFYRPETDTVPCSSSFANVENYKLREELNAMKDKMNAMENQIAKILEVNSSRHAQSPTSDVDS